MNALHPTNSAPYIGQCVQGELFGGWTLGLAGSTQVPLRLTQHLATREALQTVWVGGTPEKSDTNTNRNPPVRLKT